MTTASTSTKAQLLADIAALRHNLEAALNERDSAAAECEALRAKVGTLNTSLDAAYVRMHNYESALGGLNSKLMRDAMCPPVAAAPNSGWCAGCSPANCQGCGIAQPAAPAAPAAPDVAPWDDLPAAQAAHSELSAESDALRVGAAYLAKLKPQPDDSLPAAYVAAVAPRPGVRPCFEFDPSVRGDFARASALARQHRGFTRRTQR